MALTCSSITRQSGGKGFKTLKEGQRVEFEIEKGPKGLKAKDVRLILTRP